MIEFFCRVQIAAKERVVEPSVNPPSTDNIVKHIHFVNEKKDVGLQLSRNDLPSSSANNKSAQTRWTSTKTQSSDSHPKRHYLRTIEDPSFDDPTIAYYRPPPLYFNSDSDFLQMITPESTKFTEQAKENRLSYLASIPIVGFDEESNVEDVDDENEKYDSKKRPPSTVRFNLPSSTPSKAFSVKKVHSKTSTLAPDFLYNFPLLRSLVEEALALQRCEYDLPSTVRHVMSNQRPHSAVPQKIKNVKQSSARPKSVINIHPIRLKSAIVSTNINNTSRLYPPPSKTNNMFITKHDIRDLVDRLAKPKINKKSQKEMPWLNENISNQESTKVTSNSSSKFIISSSVYYISYCFFP